ncbi:MAG: TraB/GumN family protein [Rhizobacter sp.]
MRRPACLGRFLKVAPRSGLQSARWLIGVRLIAPALLATCVGMTTVAQAEPAAAPVRAVTREAAAHRFDRGLLWRIDRPTASGADAHSPPPSHLFGTVHIDDPRATSFSASVRRALATSRVFLPELLPDEASAQAFAAAMRAEPGQSLEALAGADEFERIAERLSARYSVPRTTASQLKPWAAYVYLSQPARPMGEIVDAALIRLAQQQGLTIRPLEAVTQQIAAMEAIPVASQLALLSALARDHDGAMAEIDQLVNLYLAKDLAGLRRLEESAARDDPSLRQPMADLIEQILDRRNESMLATLVPEIQAGGAFAAMGALHLTGEQGLLARLARAGWRVRRVD